MGRPRKHESNAARQKAYREREKLKEHDPKKEAQKALRQLVCAVFVPHGTRCKFCGKKH